jgi:hypothetical protein
MLASFFAMVAVMLAGIGLYGALDYSVLQRRREIGIRGGLFNVGRTSRRELGHDPWFQLYMPLTWEETEKLARTGKVCGEFISPDGVEILEELEVWERFRRARAVRLRSDKL